MTALARCSKAGKNSVAGAEANGGIPPAHHHACLRLRTPRFFATTGTAAIPSHIARATPAFSAPSHAPPVPTPSKLHYFHGSTYYLSALPTACLPFCAILGSSHPPHAPPACCLILRNNFPGTSHTSTRLPATWRWNSPPAILWFVLRPLPLPLYSLSAIFYRTTFHARDETPRT